MLIPVGHENMTVRRWPVVTAALILINLLAFIVTNGTLEKEVFEMEILKLRIVELAAIHPDIHVPPEIQPVITDFREKHPREWEKISSQEFTLADLLSPEMFRTEEYASPQAKMNALAEEFARIMNSYMAYQYAFVPVNPNPAAYLTANFLHGGWLHLIGNMWFLWLAGFVLEDVWGRVTYLVFYIIAGAAALQFYAWTNAGSLTPTLGASGAVAALMGAFLIRFPKIKIEMRWFYFLFRSYRFKASAYWLLSLWLLTEILYGFLFGTETGVAHWAHVGGFIFGAVAALIIRHSGFEHTINNSIEKRITGVGDPEIRQAHKYIDNKKFDEATALLKKHTAANRTSLDGWNLLREASWQKQDFPTYQRAALKCCELHMKIHDDEAAWRDYEDYVNAGGKDLPLTVRFDLCRLLENQGHLETAVSEYGLLAAAHPAERQAVMAQLAAGKICLQKLNRPHDALKFFEAAGNSPVPHLDFEQTIQASIQEAKSQLPPVSTNAMGSEVAKGANGVGR